MGQVPSIFDEPADLNRDEVLAQLRAAIQQRDLAQLRSAMNAAVENGVTGAVIEKANRLRVVLATQQLRAAIDKHDLTQLRSAMNTAVESGVEGTILDDANTLMRVLATEALHAAIGNGDLATLWSALNAAVQEGVDEAVLEETRLLFPFMITQALQGAIEARDLATLRWTMNTAGVMEGVEEVLIEEARAILPGVLAQNRLIYLQSIVAANTQIDAITGKPVRMDGEMVNVSTDTGEGASGLHTWELAHTEEEAAQLAKATMNKYDGRIPMFHNP